MTALSPWAATAEYRLTKTKLPTLYKRKLGTFSFEVRHCDDSLWITAAWSRGKKISFRAAFSPGAGLNVVRSWEKGDGVELFLATAIGKFRVNISFPRIDQIFLRYTTSLIPDEDMLFPFWPRDIVPHVGVGKVHLRQVGTRSGLIYLSLVKPKAGSLLYFQNLSALSDYCQQTETSCANTVGGEWPELGFSLPATKDKPIKAHKEVTISDAFIVFDEAVPANEAQQSEQFLNLLASVYLQIPRPETKHHLWPATLEKGLKDLIGCPGCWSQVKGHSYFNAYVSDYKTPPESMVQLAILLPLKDYSEWSGSEVRAMKKIEENLPTFYDKKIGSIVRWLPAAADKLEGEEEQKQPLVMDSWYLHHPLLNLSRLALKGDKVAEKLFLDSLDFVIRVARHFKYRWPVFYKMDTLEVVKAETAPGKGGEKDVAGSYAHIMLQAWELTRKKRYLQEAEKAAKTLEGLGFEMFYQANNTSFAAGALLRLWKLTRKKTYLQLSYLCLANIFKNVQLWECDYGYGRNFPSFFALFPLNDAPYTAVYEEQEVFCAFHDYLKEAEGESILPAVRLLLSEYSRYLVYRAAYYYPPMLPKEMLEEKPKVGEIDPTLWIALEDLHDGWEKSGAVGQEVYGAGNAFGILPRHYLRLPGENFMVFCEYPVIGSDYKKGKPLTFRLLGDGRLSCRIRIVPDGKKAPPEAVLTRKGQREPLEGKSTPEGQLEYIVPGDAALTLRWGKSAKKPAKA